MGLFFWNVVIFTLKFLKAFQRLDYPLIYAPQVMIICFKHGLEHTSTRALRHYAEVTELRKFNGREVVK